MDFHEVQHVQEWWIWAIVIGAGLPTLVIAFVMVWSARRPATKRRARAVMFILAAFFLINSGVPCALVSMVQMTTDVGSDGVHVTISLFLDDTIPCSTILDARVRRYDPLREFGGWGVRRGVTGRAYNMTGDRGVQLIMTDATGLLIGSQRPEELESAIHGRCKQGR